MQATPCSDFQILENRQKMASETSSLRRPESCCPLGSGNPRRRLQNDQEQTEGHGSRPRCRTQTALPSGKGSRLESLPLPLPFMISLESRLQTAGIASNSINSIVWDEKRAILLARVEREFNPGAQEIPRPDSILNQLFNLRTITVIYQPE